MECKVLIWNILNCETGKGRRICSMVKPTTVLMLSFPCILLGHVHTPPTLGDLGFIHM